MTTAKKIEFVIDRRMDQHGRIALPPIYRKMLQAETGDTFQCRIQENGDIVLSLVKETLKNE